MPSGLFDRLQRILPLAKKVADEIVSEETETLNYQVAALHAQPEKKKKTETLKELIPQMFEVMHRVAKLSCDYVKHGR